MLNRRQRRDGTRDPAEWRALTIGAALLTVCLVVTVLAKNVLLSVILAVLVSPMAFVAGYLYRANLLHRGDRGPRFLRVTGDKKADQ